MSDEKSGRGTPPEPVKFNEKSKRYYGYCLICHAPTWNVIKNGVLNLTCKKHRSGR